MEIVVNINEQLNVEKLKKDTLGVFLKNGNHNVIVDIQILNKTVDRRIVHDYHSFERILDAYSNQFNEYVKKIDALKDRYDFETDIKDIDIKFVSNPVTEDTINDVTYSTAERFRINISNGTCRQFSAIYTKKDAIKNLTALKYIFDTSKEIYEEVWRKNDIKSKCSVTDKPWGHPIMTDVNIYDIDMIVSEILKSPESKYKTLTFFRDTIDMYLYADIKNPVHLNFFNKKDAIKWLYQVRTIYLNFKENMVEYLIDNSLNDDIILFISRYI